jgi:hypothetical protein
MTAQSEIKKLLVERGTVHGNFSHNAEYSQKLKQLFRRSIGWEFLDQRQKEALDNIALKLSRILSSKVTNKDAWVDLQGYAALAVPEDPEIEA